MVVVFLNPLVEKQQLVVVVAVVVMVVAVAVVVVLELEMEVVWGKEPFVSFQQGFRVDTFVGIVGDKHWHLEAFDKQASPAQLDLETLAVAVVAVVVVAFADCNNLVACWDTFVELDTLEQALRALVVAHIPFVAVVVVAFLALSFEEEEEQ